MKASPYQTPIGLSQHAFLVGVTGGGKSTRMLLQLSARLAILKAVRATYSSYRIVLVDSKRVGFGKDDNLGHYADYAKRHGGIISRDYRALPWNNATTHLFIYRPIRANVTPEHFSDFFAFMNGLSVRTARGPVALPFLIIIDELTDIAADDRSRLTYMKPFTQLMTEGRDLMQTAWILTQSPRFIFGDIRRNTTARFKFRLPDPEDADYVSKIMGYKPVRERNPDPFGFWYQNDLLDSTTPPIYVSQT